MAEWVPDDDFTPIMIALMNIDARGERVGEHVVAIRRILEGDDGGEEKED